jgi:ADP-ribosylglycohydrolase
MRVSPVGHAFAFVDQVLEAARRSAECTHNHPEGVKGAQAVALAVFLARHDEDKETIRRVLRDRFRYDLSRTLDQIRPTYAFDITCQGSFPEAILSFLDSNDFGDAVRNAVSLGGDADTQACIAGAIAQAYYKAIPQTILEEIGRRLSRHLWHKTIEFYRRYGVSSIVGPLMTIDGG